MNTSLTISAPGKLMLMGEHAVVYGHPSLVTAVDERLHVSIEPADSIQFITPHTNDTRFLEAALVTAKKKFGIENLSVKITTHNGFCSVKGFGSSSAVTVAVIKAIADFTNHAITLRELFDAAYETVLSVQGVGSGFDVAAATYGGTLLFTKGGGILEPLSYPTPLPLVIGYTGVKADTATIVKEIAKKREAETEKVDRIFDAIAKLVGDATEKIKTGDWERVGKLMDFNQEYLRDLGVSSTELENLISAAKSAGAYGAKLSGAGRGDCMIALVNDKNRRKVEEAITKAGGEVVRVGVAAPGVTIDTTDNQSELFVVVDNDDNVIGYKTRGQCHTNSFLLHRAVGILIFDKDGKVLLQKRSRTKDTDPGKWTDSTSGHVMKDETYEQTARREVKEELGVDIPVTFHSKFITVMPTETEMDALFTAMYDGPVHPNTEEVETVARVGKEELKEKVEKGEIELTLFARKALQTVGFLS
jgi:mevalonate kinase